MRVIDRQRGEPGDVEEQEGEMGGDGLAVTVAPFVKLAVDGP